MYVRTKCRVSDISVYRRPHAIQMNLLSSHDKDFTAKYFRHEIYAGDSDACGSKDFSGCLKSIVA